MTDEYNNEGSARYRIELTRGDEQQTIEVCADSAEDATEVARKVAEDEDYIVWENPDEDLLFGRITPLEYDDDPQDSDDPEQGHYM